MVCQADFFGATFLFFAGLAFDDLMCFRDFRLSSADFDSLSLSEVV